MTETEFPTTVAYVPGKHEAAALRAMHEIEPADTSVRRHLIAHQVAPRAWSIREWSAANGTWVAMGQAAGEHREATIDRLAEVISYANVGITDARLDFDALEGIGPDVFDDEVLDPRRVTLCPEGVPGAPDGWAVVHRGMTILPEHRFARTTLEERFRQTAAASAPLALGPGRSTPIEGTTLVRHTITARDLLAVEHWGVIGRPDLAGRAIDRELEFNAALKEEAERLWKSGIRLPDRHLRLQVEKRLEQERAAHPA